MQTGTSKFFELMGVILLNYFIRRIVQIICSMDFLHWFGFATITKTWLFNFKYLYFIC